jgi:uncharacterized pyridoxal phosphate-containing UPF0001 family protein
MGMASFTDDEKIQSEEFNSLAQLFQKWKKQMNWEFLSMGMSGDYRLALECGSNMIRVGSLLFGARR